MHYILFYEVADDYVEKRGPFRAEHLGLIQQAHDRGELVMAGALADPADGAVLVFRGSSAEAAEAFAKSDPYVKNGAGRRGEDAETLNDAIPTSVIHAFLHQGCHPAEPHRDGADDAIHVAGRSSWDRCGCVLPAAG
jgi:uncharacterized protein YciI